MRFVEILEELRRLSPEELEQVQHAIDEVRQSQNSEETPEMLAAIDEGIRSAEEGPLISLEELRKEMLTWKLSDSK